MSLLSRHCFVLIEDPNPLSPRKILGSVGALQIICYNACLLQTSVSFGIQKVDSS